tara:strand:+ start:210 stop:419 length:210 start_codon:yes stop_codon:yes gene_type:complete
MHCPQQNYFWLMRFFTLRIMEKPPLPPQQSLRRGRDSWILQPQLPENFLAHSPDDPRLIYFQINAHIFT